MAAEILTALDVRNAKPGNDPTRKAGEPQPDPSKPFKMRDGKGLFLEVRPSGLKYWRYRYRLATDKPDQMFTIGEAGDGAHQVSLADARKARSEARELVRQGIHPISARDDAKAVQMRAGENTFAAIAEEWLAEAKAGWTAHYFKQVRRGLDTDILPAIGKRPMKSITAADVRAILMARKKQPTTAALLRLWIGSVFRWAIANGIEGVKDDPTVATRRMIKRPPVQHHKPLALDEIPAFLEALRKDTGNRQTAIAAEMLLLTFVRPGEMCGAAWAEFNTDKGLWVVPAARMKMREDHYIPLSPRVLELLTELRRLTGTRTYLFPNLRSPTRPMDVGTLNKLFERIGYAPRITPHSMRATASTILNVMRARKDANGRALAEDEWMQFRPDVIERQLAHAPRDKVRASYNQAEYLPERRAMMAAWADVIDGKISADSNVVPIHAKAAA